MAQGPNVIELYEGAVENMLPILGGIREDQLTSPTLARNGTCKIWLSTTSR